MEVNSLKLIHRMGYFLKRELSKFMPSCIICNKRTVINFYLIDSEKNKHWIHKKCFVKVKSNPSVDPHMVERIDLENFQSIILSVQTLPRVEGKEIIGATDYSSWFLLCMRYKRKIVKMIFSHALSLIKKKYKNSGFYTIWLPKGIIKIRRGDSSLKLHPDISTTMRKLEKIVETF